jgi:hypothetical protein
MWVPPFEGVRNTYVAWLVPAPDTNVTNPAEEPVQLKLVAAGEHVAVMVACWPTVMLVVGVDSVHIGVPFAAPVIVADPLLMSDGVVVVSVWFCETPAGGAVTVATDVVCPLGVQRELYEVLC